MKDGIIALSELREKIMYRKNPKKKLEAGVKALDVRRSRPNSENDPSGALKETG